MGVLIIKVNFQKSNIESFFSHVLESPDHFQKYEVFLEKLINHNFFIPKVPGWGRGGLVGLGKIPK